MIALLVINHKTGKLISQARGKVGINVLLKELYNQGFYNVAVNEFIRGEHKAIIQFLTPIGTKYEFCRK